MINLKVFKILIFYLDIYRNTNNLMKQIDIKTSQKHILLMKILVHINVTVLMINFILVKQSNFKTR